jgi:exodeoxyribonuclease VII large subunit
MQPDGPILSISEVTARIRDALQKALGALWLVGEISDLARPQSGHVYLTLKDDQSQIRAVMWRSAAERLNFPLQDGLEVLCYGSIDVYGPRGSYQLVIRHMEPRGEGTAQRALRLLKQKLESEGLFDPRRKKTLPRFPRRLAIVTSPSGAAITDFLQVAQRRWRGTEILVIPASVQGTQASREIIEAVQLAHGLRPRPDTLVLARGGGSMEDLQCFNDERLVRCIAGSHIPIVSAVGHEIDVTLADLAADVRALTPSEAAELSLPSREDLASWLQQVAKRLQGLLRGRVSGARQQLTALASRRSFRAPFVRTREYARRLDELQLRATRAVGLCVETARARWGTRAAQLEALSPLAVLARGYSVTTRAEDGRILEDTREVDVGQLVMSQLRYGQLVSRVESRTDAERDALNPHSRGKRA